METTYSPGMSVIIGDEFAKVLGYEELVGSMGIIDNVLSALCGVVILSGNTEFIGKQVDIHINDCVIQEEEKKDYYVILSMDTGIIFYSENEEFIEFVHKRWINTGQSTHKFEDVHHIHQAIDFCEKELAETTKRKRERNPNFDWIALCLDDSQHNDAIYYRKRYEEKKESERRKKEAFQESKSTTKESMLVQSLRRQMEEQASLTRYEDYESRKDAYEEWDGDAY